MPDDRNPLFLPGNRIKHVSTVPSANPPEYFEPYPDEYEKIAVVGKKINARFNRTWINDDEWPDLIEYIIEEFDKIGFEVAVEPMDAFNKETGRPITDQAGRPMRVPNVSFVGRSRSKEYEADHDRIRHGVVAGKVDGVKGYIREGSDQLHEEPIKKIIT